VSKYLFLFGWRGETVAGFIKEPSDREAAMRELLQEAGGDLECLYFMFGQHDGLAIVELPDSSSAAAAAMSIAGTGAYSHFETHELISPADITGILKKAGSLHFRPPGG